MPNHSDKDESQVLDFIFRQNGSLEVNEQEKTINTYYCIKHHMPSEIYRTGKLKFNYNKGISYILASYDETQLFKISNKCKNLIEIICPPDKEFVNSLEISDTKKDDTLKKYKDTKATYWYLKLTPEEVLCFTSKHWESFNSLLKEIASR